MFRVPLRSASAGAAAIPRPSYDARRRLAGSVYGRNGWSLNGAAWGSTGNGRPATAPEPLEPAFRAPWGELEHQIPYVTITTQLFPAEWWSPPALRASAVARAAVPPVVQGAHPTAAPLATMNASAGYVAIPIEPEFDLAGVDEPFLDIIRRPAPIAVEEALEPEPSVAEPRARPARRHPKQRRSLFGRLAVVALGLVISLIAVETATRRRG